MPTIGIPQIHLVPFDLGVVFYDVLSIDNTRNLKFAQAFYDKLTLLCNSNGWVITKLFEAKGTQGKSPLTIAYCNNDFADQAICHVQIKENLSCCILSSGVGIFELADIKCEALKNTDSSITQYSKALIANYQKKVTQSAILNKEQFLDVFMEENRKMLQFRQMCWKLVEDGVRRKKIQHLRSFSGCENYKSNGLSYVLTIYLLQKAEMTQNELDHLLCSGYFSKVTNQKEWKEIDIRITTTEPQQRSPIVECGVSRVFTAWSAVAIETDSPICVIDDIRANDDISFLLKVESYVQSRWFIADNSMDNVNKNSSYTMERLQRIASLMEFYKAELDNEISANMGTIQKKLLKPVVETSEVKELYKSVLSQIKTQLKIKEAHYQDKKRKNQLIADIFLAVFTASSFYKTVIDIINETYTWVNSLIFGFMVILAIGTIIFNYKNK